MKTKNICKSGNTFYSDFRNIQGKRIRKSLGKDLAQAKIKVLHLIANINVLKQQPGTRTPLSEMGKGYKAAVTEFILSEYSEYKIDNAWNKKHWRQQKNETGLSE